MRKDTPELPKLESALKKHFEMYDSKLKACGVSQEDRNYIAKNTLKMMFYYGAENIDRALNYKDFDDFEIEKWKMTQKMNIFEKVFINYLSS